MLHTLSVKMQRKYGIYESSNENDYMIHLFYWTSFSYTEC